MSDGGPRIALLGAGATGLVMAKRLLDAGLTNFSLFEKSDGVGGTWHRHAYPGLCCDVESHVYVYSFDPNASWSRRFPFRDELNAYFKTFAEKFGILPHVRLSTPVAEVRYLEGSSEWLVTTADGEERFDYVISAVGFLTEPQIPSLPGIDSFQGEAFHSAEWRPEVALSGKRIAVVGTAASAVQIIPAIASNAVHLAVFQRTPNWVMPRNNTPYSPEEREAFAANPALIDAHRNELYGPSEEVFRGFMGESEPLQAFRQYLLDFLQSEISDPELREKLTPDYEPGCKRVLKSDDFYRTLLEPNVSLETDAIREVRPNGIMTAAGALVEVDVIIWCTGYKMPNYHGPVRTIGRGGLSLGEIWDDIPRAFRGTTVPGFPNFFMLNGPNGIFGHTSAITASEIASEYVIRLIVAAEKEGCGPLEVRRDVFDKYNDELQGKFVGSTFAGDCVGFYHDDKHRVWAFYPGTPAGMRSDFESTTLEDYLV